MKQRALLTSLLLLGLGCASGAPTPTEIVLVVTSDLAVPDALDGVRVEAAGPDGTLRTAHAALGAPGDLPVSVRLALRRDTGVALRVDVYGERAGSDVLVRSAELAFVPGQRRLLSLPLLARCVDVACDDGLSCGETGCADVQHEADTLPPYDTATFETLGEPPLPDVDADTDPPPSEPDAADAELDAGADEPEPPEDASAPPNADAAAADDAGDAGDARDTGPEPDASPDGGCAEVLVCRGLCVPLTLPGLCTCGMECAPPP